MNKLKIVAIVFLITLVSGSCKKDYPKDIPDWLENKIKEVKKKGKNTNDCCLIIDEYSDGVTTTFWFDYDIYYVHTVYDYEGNQLCTFNIVPSSSCGNINNFQDYQFIRRVWSQKEK